MNQQVEDAIGGYEESAAVASDRGQHVPAVGGDGLTSLKRIDASHQCAPKPPSADAGEGATSGNGGCPTEIIEKAAALISWLIDNSYAEDWEHAFQDQWWREIQEACAKQCDICGDHDCDARECETGDAA